VEHPHATPADVMLERLQGERDGLTGEEAAGRLAVIGPNRLPEPERDHPVLRFLKHFHDVLIYVLLAAAVVTMILSHWIDTGVILAVVVLNAVIGFVQEGQAESALAGACAPCSPPMPTSAATGTGSRSRPTTSSRVTSCGSPPATGSRRTSACSRRRTSIEEAALTGESVPTAKSPDAVDASQRAGRPLICMAYSGTHGHLRDTGWAW
jgi:magnesium-transporting ATPase (P-type)